ncbi:hypothetical protein [Candidatus Enterococcus mansonii]
MIYKSKYIVVQVSGVTGYAARVYMRTDFQTIKNPYFVIYGIK